MCIRGGMIARSVSRASTGNLFDGVMVPGNGADEICGLFGAVIGDVIVNRIEILARSAHDYDYFWFAL